MDDTAETARIASEALASAKSAHHRLDEMGKQVDAMSGKVEQSLVAQATIIERLDNLRDSMDGVKASVDSLKAQPGKRWESAVNTGLTAGVAALVGWLSAHIK